MYMYYKVQLTKTKPVGIVKDVKQFHKISYSRAVKSLQAHLQYHIEFTVSKNS